MVAVVPKTLFLIGVFCVRDFHERIPVVSVASEFKPGDHAGKMNRYRFLDKKEHMQMVGHDLLAEDAYLREMGRDTFDFCVNGFAEVGEVDICRIYVSG